MTGIDRVKEAARVLSSEWQFSLDLGRDGLIVTYFPDPQNNNTKVHDVVPWASIEQANYNPILLTARRLETAHKRRIG